MRRLLLFLLTAAASAPVWRRAGPGWASMDRPAAAELACPESPAGPPQATSHNPSPVISRNRGVLSPA
jgi:hypothetical protein